MTQQVTIRPLRLTDTWQTIRAAFQIWITDVAKVLTQGIRIRQHCYADIAVLTFTTTDIIVGFPADYPFGLPLQQRVTSGPPLGLTVIAIYDTTAPGYTQTAVLIPVYPPETPVLTWAWNDKTGTIQVLDVSATSRQRVVGHVYQVVVRIDGN